jgi:hypothetical protein
MTPRLTLDNTAQNCALLAIRRRKRETWTDLVEFLYQGSCEASFSSSSRWAIPWGFVRDD